ncbi:hypothetical protein [Oryza sativa Japonica Group]|uniref:Uncharacterized protein n=1 Tax=Oryza sativa subsp. japonica TaxID=39947 RepID=Q5N962_ORYSJ|nr:hypothetical protein [Oryza sativa Japonica Group]
MCSPLHCAGTWPPASEHNVTGARAGRSSSESPIEICTDPRMDWMDAPPFRVLTVRISHQSPPVVMTTFATCAPGRHRSGRSSCTVKPGVGELASEARGPC